ncbi:MAG: peroxide stress protein YaaA [Hyphococcus sp.]
MLMVLSPAKNLNFDPAAGAPRPTKPLFLKDAATLSQTTRKLTRGKIKSLMGISDKLADLNYERFQAFDPDGKGESLKQAALAFNGDVYQGLDAATLDKGDLKFAQDHLRILSGLYGLLRPLDAIQPYRLEMGSKLKNPRGGDLYDFWGEKIAKEIDKALKGHEDQTLVNLASNEYFSAVDKDALKAPVVTPVFREEKDGKSRMLMYYAKRARGAMARWAIRNRIESAADLKTFNEDGYAFQEDESQDDQWVFSRPQPPAKKG